MKSALLLLAFIGCVPYACTQTDIGSPSSVGSVTNDQALGTLTPAKRLELQEQQLDAYLTKLQTKTAKRQPQSELPVEKEDAETIKKAYANFRNKGNEISPFDFVAIATTVQEFAPKGLPDKTAQKIRAELDELQIDENKNGVFAEVVNPDLLKPSATPTQYHQELNRIKADLRKNLGQ